ncbi:MAG: tRNA (adenosine(37)-N6)-dimethylallyltransferase MiaA [Anaerolineales bacterium]|nr:tRNA (adenosine(37)-N6)-dimethylallyltransferase MiaA [Anaerolineales bacterium]
MLDKPLLVLLGPTAVGKTALSLHLAQHFHGEIISADSRLFYRGLDIGTAKPTPAEQALVPHHLIDICDPDQTLTLGDYQELAYAAIEDIQARGKLPLLVGGTGQYIRALVEGWGIPRVAPQPALRTALEKLGRDELARWLTLLDPPKAAEIDLLNPRRTVRALEVTLVKGVPISHQQKKTPPPYQVLQIGLHREREELYRRIDQRVDDMLEAGLVAEVQALHEAGYDWQLPSMSGLGYRQFAPYFAGEQSLAQVAERIKFETHRFVRHQKNWFQADDPRIMWLSAAAPDLWAQTTAVVENWLHNRNP